MSGRLNIDVIAELAGVSTATVSRVINDYPFVREETRRRVQEVIRSTNYQVNAVARNLRRKKTHSIGVIISNVLSPFYSVIAKAVEDVAIRNRFSTVLCNGGDDPDKELGYLKVLHENRVDGIILSPTGKNERYLRFLISVGIPVVFVDRNVPGFECDCVMVNNREASRNAVSCLLDRGYRNIGFISGPVDRVTGFERYEGYRDCYRRRNMQVDEAHVRIGDFSLESGKRLAEELIEGGGIDALYVANYDMATGAYQCLKENGIRIPEDMGFLIFDDPDWTTLVTPEVSAVKQPVYTIGSTAMELLFRQINEFNSGNGHKPQTVILETTLIRRESI
jgi:DNA-binding LacI/PurR family transcriptional regulator